MGKNTIRMMMALAAFLVLCQWSRPARADVTISGTVGEIGLIENTLNSSSNIRFKLTNVNTTATCLDAAPNGIFIGVAGYAYFVLNGDPLYKEWYAALLYSKKGAPISCTITSATNCHVTSCTLP